MTSVDRTGSVKTVAADGVLERLRVRIRAFAASRVGMDAADDLTQDVLLLLVTKYPDKTELEDLVPLAIRIVQFKMSSFTRKRVRRGEHVQPDFDTVVATRQSDDQWADPESQAERRQLRARFRQAVRQLDGRCRNVFRLKLEGRSFAEIRTEMGAPSINAVYLWDHRCRHKLKALLEEAGGR